METEGTGKGDMERTEREMDTDMYSICTFEQQFGLLAWTCSSAQCTYIVNKGIAAYEWKTAVFIIHVLSLALSEFMFECNKQMTFGLLCCKQSNMYHSLPFPLLSNTYVPVPDLVQVTPLLPPTVPHSHPLG